MSKFTRQHCDSLKTTSLMYVCHIYALSFLQWSYRLLLSYIFRHTNDEVYNFIAICQWADHVVLYNMLLQGLKQGIKHFDVRSYWCLLWCGTYMMMVIKYFMCEMHRHVHCFNGYYSGRLGKALACLIFLIRDLLQTCMTWIWVLAVGMVFRMFCTPYHLVFADFLSISPLPNSIQGIFLRYFNIFKGGAVGRVLDLQSTGRGFKSYSGPRLCNNLGQVVHTYVPLSSSSITWYQLRGGHALWLGR